MKFLESLTDEQLANVQQAGAIPLDFINQELLKRQRVRIAAEGADMAPEQGLGLGRVQYYGNV